MQVVLDRDKTPTSTSEVSCDKITYVSLLAFAFWGVAFGGVHFYLHENLLGAILVTEGLLAAKVTSYFNKSILGKEEPDSLWVKCEKTALAMIALIALSGLFSGALSLVSEGDMLLGAALSLESLLTLLLVFIKWQRLCYVDEEIETPSTATSIGAVAPVQETPVQETLPAVPEAPAHSKANRREKVQTARFKSLTMIPRSAPHDNRRPAVEPLSPIHEPPPAPPLEDIPPAPPLEGIVGLGAGERAPNNANFGDLLSSVTLRKTSPAAQPSNAPLGHTEIVANRDVHEPYSPVEYGDDDFD